MEFLTEEQRLIQETVRRISREKIAPHVDEAYEKGKASREILKALAENGLLIISLPREFGGIEANATTRALVIEELAKVDGSTSMYVFTSQALPAFLLAYGTHEQKERFFGFLSSGDKICSFCLTEPNHGSDARSIKTTATLDGDHYKLNGTKSFISSGTLASLYLVFARTKEGISSFIVERDTPGFTRGAPEKKFGFRSSEMCQLFFEDATVPKENLLGHEGAGWSQLQDCGAALRAWGAGAQALGIAQGAMEYALKYAKERVQFGVPIIKHQGLQFMLADMAIQIEAARSLVYRTTRMLDAGYKVIPIMTSAAKCFASDVAMKVTTDAVQVLGGYGIMEDYAVHRMMRDAKATQIFDGTNQIQRRIIGRKLMEG